MVKASRREVLAASAIATLAGLAPGVLFAADAPGTAAAWNLADLYADQTAWDIARKAALADVGKLNALKGTLGQSAAAMRAALQAIYDLQRTVSRIYTYASLKADEDQRVSRYQEMQSQATDLYTVFGERTAWLSPEIPGQSHFSRA